MITEKLFKKMKDYNIEELEVYLENTKTTSFRIYEGQLENFTKAKEKVMSIRGIYDGKMGYSYTEKIEEDEIDQLLENLVKYAKNNDSDYIAEFPVEFSDENRREKESNDLDHYTDEEKIEYLMEVEKSAKEYSEAVKAVKYCNYSEEENNIYIKNSKGLEIEDSYNTADINLSVVTEKNNNVQTGYSYLVIDDLTDEYKETLVEEAVSDSVKLLGASPVKSKNYEIILRNNVVANILAYMLGVFKGDVVQKNLSLLKGKIQKKIANKQLSLKENPFMKKGKVNRYFDDEGSKTYEKYIIKDGFLQTFFHNKETAKKAGVSSTANGFRPSHKKSIEVMPTNVYIEEGKYNLDEMIKTIDEGIIITDVQGLHAGINNRSGDISLSSKGFFIENGKIEKPVSQITFSGNFYDILKEVSEIGNDINFRSPNNYYVGAPSIKVDNITIAGT